MKLLDDFFKVINTSTTGEHLEIVVELNAGHIIYTGHFPGQPVTPGVIQLQIINELLEFELGMPLKLQSISQCKFLKILNPLETPFINVQLEYDLDCNLLNVKTQVINGTSTYLKLSAIYQLD